MFNKAICTISLVALLVCVVAFLHDIAHDSRANLDIVACSIGVMVSCGIVFAIKTVWED